MDQNRAELPAEGDCDGLGWIGGVRWIRRIRGIGRIRGIRRVGRIGGTRGIRRRGNLFHCSQKHTDELRRFGPGDVLGRLETAIRIAGKHLGHLQKENRILGPALNGTLIGKGLGFHSLLQIQSHSVRISDQHGGCLLPGHRLRGAKGPIAKATNDLLLGGPGHCAGVPFPCRHIPESGIRLVIHSNASHARQYRSQHASGHGPFWCKSIGTGSLEELLGYHILNIGVRPMVGVYICKLAVLRRKCGGNRCQHHAEYQSQGQNPSQQFVTMHCNLFFLPGISDPVRPQSRWGSLS